jgi:hypothetical protein
MDGHFKLAFVVLTRSQLEEVGGYMYMCIYKHAILLRERERERKDKYNRDPYGSRGDSFHA